MKTNGINPETVTSRELVGVNAQAMTDDGLLAYLDKEDPDAEHDDLHEPDGHLAIYWREAGNRGLLNQ